MENPNAKSPFRRMKARKKIQYFLKKIKISNLTNTDKKNYLDTVYNEPSSYFNNIFEGKPVIFGNKSGVLNSEINHQTKKTINKENKNLKLIKGQYRYETNEKKALNEMRRESMQKKEHSIFILPKNQTYINDEELDYIYDKFKNLKEINKKNNTTKEYDKNYINSFQDELLKNELKHKFDIQKKIIDHKKKKEKNEYSIAYNLSKKLNRPMDSLLITQSNLYRNKQEYKNTICNELNNLKPLPLYRWMTDLRSDNEDHYVNVGGAHNPQWHIYHRNRKKLFEIVRKPDVNFQTISLYNKSSDFLKKKLPEKTYYNLKNLFKTVDKNINSIHIEGNDLLNFEQNISKTFKGKKIISLSNDNNYILKISGENNNIIDQSNNTITFKENTNTRNYLKTSFKSFLGSMSD